ncbi:MAG TPA: exopolysaccharide biosynthesis protein [Rhizobiaceae bacterium]|nr:exopolysaccharide biosynthesis protein [Rhizobiaceae bacterium]
MSDTLADFAFPKGYPRPQRPLSQVLRELGDATDESISVDQVRTALGDRSFSTFIAFVAVINCLPVPPFSTMVLGIPLVLIALQMVFGYPRIWLPHFILSKSISKSMFGHMSKRMIPWLQWMEKFVRPRRWPFADPRQADLVIGVILLVLGIAVVAPIPLGNWPPAFSVLIVSVALTERDGVWLAIGCAAGVASLLIIALVLGLAGAAAMAAFG